jgi:NADH-quinone oxidoreductase subunit A
MAIKYFLTAILFVLFDVEVIFFYPYAVNFKELGWPAFWAVVMFVGFFLCGFIYIIKRRHCSGKIKLMEIICYDTSPAIFL